MRVWYVGEVRGAWLVAGRIVSRPGTYLERDEKGIYRELGIGVWRFDDKAA
jgi:hypothetical protein